MGRSELPEQQRALPRWLLLRPRAARERQRRRNPRNNLDASKRPPLCDARKEEAELPSQQFQQLALLAARARALRRRARSSAGFRVDYFQSFEHSCRLHHDNGMSCLLENYSHCPPPAQQEAAALRQVSKGAGQRRLQPSHAVQSRQVPARVVLMK